MRVIFVSRHLLKFIELAITKESGGIYRLYIYLWQGNHVPVACVFRCRLGCVQLRYRACKLHIGARTWFIVLTTHTHIHTFRDRLNDRLQIIIGVRRTKRWHSSIRSMILAQPAEIFSSFTIPTTSLSYDISSRAIRFFSLPSFFPSPGSKITRNCSSSSIKILTRD